MDIQKLYRWEAETAGGEIINAQSLPAERRGDLSDCVGFALIPDERSGLPRHDIAGVKMIRRFCRGFKKSYINQRRELPGKLFWKDGDQNMKTDTDWTQTLNVGDMIGKGVAGDRWYTVIAITPDSVTISEPYRGISKPQGMFCRYLPAPKNFKSFIYLHCVVCENFRIWVNYETGAMLIAPHDQEVYI